MRASSRAGEGAMDVAIRAPTDMSWGVFASSYRNHNDWTTWLVPRKRIDPAIVLTTWRRHDDISLRGSKQMQRVAPLNHPFAMDLS
jgi:hypothetical protein